MTDEKIVTDVYGTVIFPNLHDGSLAGVLREENGDILLFCRNSSLEESVFCLRNPAKLSINNYEVGSIILDVTIYKSNAAKDRIEKIFLDLNRSGQNALESKIDSGYVIIGISPSYGAVLSCVCAQVDLVTLKNKIETI